VSTTTLDHEDNFNSRLTAPFKDKATFQALARICGKYGNELEQVFADILTARVLATAVGKQIDVIGSIVGQLRGTADDDTYKLYIEARIKVNRSSGQVDELSEIAKLISGSSYASVEEDFPNQIYVHVLDVAVSSTVRGVMTSMLHDAKAEAIALFLHTNTSPPEEAFAFSGGPGAGFGSGHLSSLRKV
jgi:hypothetical protein